MKRALVAAGVVLLSLSLAAQTTKSKDAKKATSKQEAGVPSKALMQEMLAVWGSMDVDKAAQYYVKGSNAFYDIAPMKYSSWAEYEAGVKKLFEKYKSCRFELSDDALVHRAGNVAWGTATWYAELERKDGGKDAFDLRWTVVWEKRRDGWLIVHEHVSAPLPPEPAAK